MDTNDMIQWITVGVIIVIALFIIVRKVAGFRKRFKEGEDASCGCGCAGCTQDCGLKKNKKEK